MPSRALFKDKQLRLCVVTTLATGTVVHPAGALLLPPKPLAFSSSWDCRSGSDNQWLCRTGSNPGYSASLESVSRDSRPVPDAQPGGSGYNAAFIAVPAPQPEPTPAGEYRYSSAEAPYPGYTFNSPVTDSAVLLELLNAPADHYVLQWLAANSREPLEKLKTRYPVLQEATIAQYQRAGKHWFILLDGPYPSRIAAMAALKREPRAAIADRFYPWTRSVASIQQLDLIRPDQMMAQASVPSAVYGDQGFYGRSEAAGSTQDGGQASSYGDQISGYSDQISGYYPPASGYQGRDPSVSSAGVNGSSRPRYVMVDTLADGPNYRYAPPAQPQPQPGFDYRTLNSPPDNGRPLNSRPDNDPGYREYYPEPYSSPPPGVYQGGDYQRGEYRGGDYPGGEYRREYRREYRDSRVPPAPQGYYPPSAIGDRLRYATVSTAEQGYVPRPAQPDSRRAHGYDQGNRGYPQTRLEDNSRRPVYSDSGYGYTPESYRQLPQGRPLQAPSQNTVYDPPPGSYTIQWLAANDPGPLERLQLRYPALQDTRILSYQKGRAQRFILVGGTFNSQEAAQKALSLPPLSRLTARLYPWVRSAEGIRQLLALSKKADTGVLADNSPLRQMMASPDSRYTIQWYAANQPEVIQRMKQRFPVLSDAVTVYFRRNKKDWYVLLQGQFRSSQEAISAMRSPAMREAARVLHPWTRPVNSLKALEPRDHT